jgi:pimeloyl-ACP methyl ester carboxylesterase
MRGGGATLTTDYTTLAEDLASHGYIVVGFDAPYRSWLVVLPDGRIVPRAPQNNLDNFGGRQVDTLAETLAQAWTSDCRFVLDQLERLNASDPAGRFRGRLDLEHVGSFGHSLGGATSLLLCHDDPRCKVGIDIDGAPLGPVISEGLTVPFMFILGDHRGEAAAGQPESIRNARANIRSIHDRLPDDRRLMIHIRGANHFLFSDNGALLKSPLAMRVLHWLGIVGLDGRRQLAVTAGCVRRFFDVHLKGASAADLKQLDYPEIEFVSATDGQPDPSP